MAHLKAVVGTLDDASLHASPGYSDSALLKMQDMPARRHALTSASFSTLNYCGVLCQPPPKSGIGEATSASLWLPPLRSRFSRRSPMHNPKALNNPRALDPALPDVLRFPQHLSPAWHRRRRICLRNSGPNDCPCPPISGPLLQPVELGGLGPQRLALLQQAGMLPNKHLQTETV